MMLPLQTVVLYGSGFIARKARVIVRRYPWGSVSDGRLVPEPVDLPIIGWDSQQSVPVYGAASHPPGAVAETYAGDFVVFDWQVRLAEEGLYEFQLEFENETDPRHPSSALQTPAPECRLVHGSQPLATPAVWFAVLPALAERKISPRVTHLHCHDETNPERIGPFNYFDDMIVQASVGVRHITLMPGNTEPEVVAQHAPDAPEHMFWNSGDGWPLDLHLLDPAGDPIALRFDRIMAPAMSALEIFGETDKALLKIVLVVAYVALLVLLTALLVVAVMALVAGAFAILVLAGLISAGTATALGVTLLGSLFVFLAPVVLAIWGTLLVGGIAAITGLVDHLPIGPKLIVGAAPVFQGVEVAHLLSPLRFRRRLWLLQRPSRQGDADAAMSTDFSDPVQPRLIEKYAGSAAGGRYEIRLDLVASVL
ncbi:MAG: hypothetical protein IPF55_19885 [Rhodoferax sp.]|nr:hypothetical protein [Rhodoferax sp.]